MTVEECLKGGFLTCWPCTWVKCWTFRKINSALVYGVVGSLK